MGLRSLEIGKRALLAQKFGLDVTSNNIANVNTPGYSRRTAELSEASPTNVGGIPLGNGTDIAGLRNYRQEFYDREVRTNSSRLSTHDINVEFYQRIESILAEPSDLGLNEQVNNLFTAFDELAMQPESIGMREYVISQSVTLAERFNTTAKQLADTRRDALDKLNLNVSKANQIIREISSLNVDIANSKVSLSNEAQSMIDERQLKLEELSSLMDIKVTESENKSINVHSNGINLVTANTYSELKLNETVDQSTGERTIELQKVGSSNQGDIRVDVQAGEFAALLGQFNVMLDNLDTSGEFSVAAELDSFANALVQNVNEIAVNGYGLDDPAGPPPARAFFEPSVGNATAFTIAVSDELINNSRNLQISDAPNEPGNANIAIQIAKLAQDPDYLNGQSPSQYYSGFLGRLGNNAEDAIDGQNTTRLVTDQLENLRESEIGVNLDEEAVNLVKFQRAFEAASRVVNSVNEMLVTIVNLGR